MFFTEAFPACGGTPPLRRRWHAGGIDFDLGILAGVKEKEKMKKMKFVGVLFLGVWAVLSLFPTGAVLGQDAAEISQKSEAPELQKTGESIPPQVAEPAPKSGLDNLKTEWEAVREQQVQMIREKEDQLEKLKEEIFAKMKTPSEPAVTGESPKGEPSKAAFQIERQKFFAEMNRQKENLRQLQLSLDEKAKQLAAERASFEQEKKLAAR